MSKTLPERDAKGRFIKRAKVALAAPTPALARLPPAPPLVREVLGARPAPIAPLAPAPALERVVGTVLRPRRWVGQEWTPVGWMEGSKLRAWAGSLAVLAAILAPITWYGFQVVGR